MKESPWDRLSPRLTPERRSKLLAAADHRTDRLRLVLQDVHNPHNISACLRSAEAFGVRRCDVVSLDSRYKPSGVARGVAGWLMIERYKAIADCAAQLKASGYLIAAAVLKPGACTLQELPSDRPVALLFGNEHSGVSPEWEPYCDQYFTIPMVGLVQSLNISVSAAICLQRMTERMRATMGDAGYHLNQEQKRELLDIWATRQMSETELATIEV